MKEARIIDMDGYMFDVSLVDDSVTGVIPIYEQSQLGNEEEPQDPVLVAYTVAVPVTPGLYKPRFDFAAWDAYQEAVIDYQEALEAWAGSDEGTPMPTSTADISTCWIEGLTPEELDAIKNAVPPKSTEDKLEESLALVAQLRQEIAVQKDINAANSADFMALVDYLAEKGVIE